MISKIGLGTVQFGQDYGIANAKGQISKEEAFKILDYAKSVGIDCVDTASAYGVSEAIIGEYIKQKSNYFNVVSKLPSLEQHRAGSVEKLLNQSMERIGVKSLYGYLVHKFNDVLIDDDIWRNLVHLKRSGFIEKIGFSLYSPDELVSLLDKETDFNIVQIPYSVFDRRFEDYFDVLQEKGVEVHVRSVFLQGLAFLNLNDLPVSFQQARPQLENLRRIAKERKIPVAALCLNFALLNPGIEKVIVGVDSLSHLKKNVASVDFMGRVKDVYAQLRKSEIEQEDVLLPYKWH